MSDTDSQMPFRPLGRRLKELRVRAKESLAEASGAVEIDVRELASFELGKARPAEDILLLLISHFGAQDDEAVAIWETAGYGADKVPVARTDNNLLPTIPVEAKGNHVLYTDVVDITVNNHGVVMSFTQTGPANSSYCIARVGMSREHAKSILKILQATLSQTEQSRQETENNNSQPKS
ncbi:MAG TPA: helix-turn-helix transcriptional regulator [Candidatus Saccharimonadales bacterium]|nr:helix-turn-helix transcriptional regulator [Candidatus Saccharimonadales bacterium]